MKRKILKKAAMFGLTVVLLTGTSNVALAAEHVGACGATGRSVYCGSLLQNVGDGSHLVYITSNGTRVTCNKTKELHYHTIKYSGCGATMEQNVVRTCRIKHQYCPTEENVCK